MKKSISVGRFTGVFGEKFLVGGQVNVDRMRKNHPEFPVTERRLSVDVPGVILGTPEDWDMKFREALAEAQDS